MVNGVQNVQKMKHKKKYPVYESTAIEGFRLIHNLKCFFCMTKRIIKSIF
jgi:hypothetical protein